MIRLLRELFRVAPRAEVDRLETELAKARAELAAELSAATLASLIAHSSDFIGLAAPDGAVVFVNPAGQKLVGLGGDERVRGTRIYDYVFEEDRPIIEAELMGAAMQDGGWRGELRFRHFETGAPIPMLVNSFFIKEPGTGRKVALATISRDITERKQREETLREYEKVVEGLEEMITVVDRDYRYRLANRAFLEYRGLTNELLIGRHAPEMLNPGVFEKVVKEKLEEAFAGQSVHYEMRYHYRLHGERDLSISYFPIEGPHGIDRVGCVFQDITERKRVEARLRRNEAYLAEGERMSHTGSWAWNAATGDIFWSEEHYRIFGFEPGQVKPSYEMFLSLVRPDDRAMVRQAFESSVAAKAKYEARFRICRPDGNLRHVHALAHPAFDEAGAILEYVGTLIDCTEQRQAEETLQKLQTELAHVTRVTLMGELTASIAHELNQPLGAIVNNGSVCLRLLELPRAQPAEDEMRAALADIVSDSNRASAIIARIRALARRAPPENVWLGVQEVIADVMALAQRELAGRGVATQIRFPPDLPRVFADRVELQQVLLNLVINGLEAMSGVSEERRVLTVRAEGQQLDGEPMVAISIHDLGTGIGSIDPERLFEAFYTTKPEGMGMGLRISRSIVEACQGHLWAAPNLGGGMTFICALPAETSSAL